MEKIISKSVLKEKDSYYYEYKNWYDECPTKLPLTEFKTEIFTRAISHGNILKKYNITPYSSYTEAAAVCASIIPTLKNDYKGRVVYFKENDVLYRFDAWRFDDGQLYLVVDKVNLDSEFGPGDGVCFSNGHLDTSDSDTLTLESFDARLKKVEQFIEKMKNL